MSIMTDTAHLGSRATAARRLRHGLPAGPPLPQWAQTVLMMYRWPGFVAACRKRYGSVFTVDIASMGRVVYLADPADIRTVFAGDAEVYRAGEANGTVLRGVLGDTSVLVIDGAEHRDRRKLMLPSFHRDSGGSSASGWPLPTR